MASVPEEASTAISLGPVLTRGFAALRANFPAFFAAAFLSTGFPTMIAENPRVASLGSQVPDYLIWPFAIALASVPLLGFVLLEGFVIRAAILHMSGRPPEYGASAFNALRLILPLTGIYIVTVLAVGLGLVLAIVPGIIAYCALVLAVPALVEERRGVSDSLRRSRDLTSGSRWPIFMLSLLCWAISFVLAALASKISGVSMFDPAAAEGGIRAIPEAITSSLSSVLTATMIAALYVELRTVKEGATEETLAAIFE
ncbi:MAG TPA: hypothetical protein VIT38_14040 [Allosphingosinicella sp.]